MHTYVHTHIYTHINCIFYIATYVGLGEYHLRATYKSIEIDLKDLDLISTRNPGDIVKHLKDRNPDYVATNVTAENFDDGSEKLNIDSQPVAM